MKSALFASGAMALALLLGAPAATAQDFDLDDEAAVVSDEAEDPAKPVDPEVEADEPAFADSDDIVAEDAGEDGETPEAGEADESAPAVEETVVVEVPEPEGDEPAPVDETDEPEAYPAEEAEPVPADPGQAPVAQEGESLVSMAFEQSTLEDVVAAFRTQTGANIVNGWTNQFTQLVSVRLDDVPWTQGLSSILVPFGLQLREEPRGSHIYIVAEPRRTAPPRFIETFELKHLEAVEVAKLLAGILPKDSLVYAEPSANVVVVKATDEQINECKSVLAKIDKPAPQVYIEARFVRLSAGASKKLGLKWDSLENFSVSMSHLTGGFGFTDTELATYRIKQHTKYGSDALGLSEESSGTRKPGANFQSIPPAGSLSAFDSSDSKTTTWALSHDADAYRAKERARGLTSIAGVSDDHIGGWSVSPVDSTLANLTGDDLNYRRLVGFGGQLSVSDFSLVMSAFEQLDGVQIFSNPKIIVRNGKTAVVDMTEKYPNVKIDYQQSTESGQRDSISSSLATIPGKSIPWVGEAFFSYGITLEVTPTVSPNGLITVEIVPTISTLSRMKTVYVTSDSSIGNEYPIIAMQKLDTKFTMEDGKTAVIGGLSETTEKTVDSGIPLLRHIPWIGPRLFGWKSREKSQNEILVFVTVRVADPATQAVDGLPKNAILGQMLMEGRIKEPGDRTEDEMWDLETKPVGYSIR